jgi:hypothetical protein
MAIETTRFPIRCNASPARNHCFTELQIETPCFIADHVVSASLLSQIRGTHCGAGALQCRLRRKSCKIR